MASNAVNEDVSLFIAYMSLISMAVLPIFFGSFASLRTPKSVLKARKVLKKARADKTGKGEGDDEDDEEDDEPAASETLTSSDAWLFPVVGSCVLFSMYLVFKFLDRKWVDRILGSYFAIAGAGAVFQVSPGSATVAHVLCRITHTHMFVFARLPGCPLHRRRSGRDTSLAQQAHLQACNH
jgi:minor histocompatibility antigen H13